MATFTADQIARLAEIIKLHSNWLTWRLLGGQQLTEDDLQKLKDQNILPMDVSVSMVGNSFVMGELEALLKESEWKGLSFEDLQEAASSKHTDVQKLQIQAAEKSAFAVLRDVEEDLQQGVRDLLKKEVKTGISSGRRLREVAQDLEDKTKETKRNWMRVASTEMHSARQQGVVDAITSGTDVYRHADGKNSKVSVVPDGSACQDCRRLYLDKSGNPKVFVLSELQGNEGTNYIKPWRQNAYPVVPPLHPHCFCRLSYIPDGWEWVDGKLSFEDPDALLAGMRRKNMASEKTEKALDILRKGAHDLLNSSHSLQVPTEEEIQNGSPEDLRSIIGRIHGFQKMYAGDRDRWEALEKLEIASLSRAMNLSEKNEQPNS